MTRENGLSKSTCILFQMPVMILWIYTCFMIRFLRYKVHSRSLSFTDTMLFSFNGYGSDAEIDKRLQRE